MTMNTKAAHLDRRKVLALSAALATDTTFAKTQDTQKVSAHSSRFMESSSQAGFNGALLVARRHQKLLSKGYGRCNFELDVPNRPYTPFKIGSISKLFTAQALLLIVDAGMLSLDDPLSKYMASSPPSWTAIRIRQLLNHSSGIPDIVRIGDFGERMLHHTTLDEIVGFLKTQPLDFPPGNETHYGNSGSIVAAYLVQTLSRTPFAQFLDERIYAPLKLENSGWANNAAIIRGRASGYQREEGILRNASFIDMSLPVGAGAQYSTVEDLYQWWHSFESHALLSQSSTDEMFRAGAGGYGLGWKIETTKYGKKVSHIGDINGFCGHVAAWPDAGVFSVVLSNIEKTDVETINNSVAEIAFDEYAHMDRI